MRFSNDVKEVFVVFFAALAGMHIITGGIIHYIFALLWVAVSFFIQAGLTREKTK
jgi:hypothetical protein